MSPDVPRANVYQFLVTSLGLWVRGENDFRAKERVMTSPTLCYLQELPLELIVQVYDIEINNVHSK